MPTRYIHFVQIFRGGRWIDFESYEDLIRARRRAAECRQQGVPAQIVSEKSAQPLEPRL